MNVENITAKTSLYQSLKYEINDYKNMIYSGAKSIVGSHPKKLIAILLAGVIGSHYFVDYISGNVPNSSVTKDVGYLENKNADSLENKVSEADIRKIALRKHYGCLWANYEKKYPSGKRLTHEEKKACLRDLKEVIQALTKFKRK